ncbi:MAG: HD domain-containing protein [Verrucomicrobia bacterium]|nr:HD domain-containing protein [Verrucomicrobiota bacterium]
MPRRSNSKKSTKIIRREPTILPPKAELLANAGAIESNLGLLNWLTPQGAPKSELHSPTQIILQAFRYSALKHRQQTLADGVTPYFVHVVRVCWILRDVFQIKDTATIAASILHDVVEDTNTAVEEIEELFGKTIANYVDLLTKDPALPKRQRDRDYDEKLLNAPEPVQIAKLADLYDNLSRRIGTTRLPSTIENARRLAAKFERLLTSRRGRAALGRVQRLISEIESSELGRQPRKRA